MLHYARRSPAQWALIWEHEMKADPDCMESMLRAHRVKDAILNATADDEFQRKVIGEKIDVIVGEAGVTSYTKGHLTGFYDCAEQCKETVELAHRAVKFYRWWGAVCFGVGLLVALL
jgi:hypothetical protein